MSVICIFIFTQLYSLICITRVLFVSRKSCVNQSRIITLYRARGNKITIYSLKLRELSTLMITCYTYFLLSVSRQAANNTPSKFNCTQYIIVESIS